MPTQQHDRDVKTARKLNDARFAIDSTLAVLQDRSGVNVRKLVEPKVYGPGSDQSFFMDLVNQHSTDPDVRAQVQKRLERNLTEIRVDDRARYDAIRTEARRQKTVREDMREQRAGTTGSLLGFAPPQWLTSLWAPFNAPADALVRQCRNLPLPQYGMEIDVPSLTSALTVTQSYENQQVSETDPSGADLGPLAVSTFSGGVTVSQQLYDRGGAPGYAFDEIIVSQAGQQLAAQVDSYVIAQCIANAGTVTDGTTLTIPLFWGDVSKAREQLADTAGTRLPGTHVFSTTDLLGWITKQVDSQNRPIIIPDASAIELASANGADVKGYSGILLPGSLKWFADDNIPTPSGHPTWTQVLVVQAPEILVWSGAPITFSAPETDAQTLSVVVGLRQYAASVPRYAKAVQQITGAGYANLS
jgi:hypothetical protein